MRDGHRLLREATREAHERLDALFMGFDLSQPDGYRRFIGAQASAMLPVEAALDAGGAEGVVADWPDRRRGALLAADAHALDLVPRPVGAPTLANPAAQASALYVIEGSRHGARHLRRMVPQGMPSAFLDAEQVPGRWAVLLDRIDTILYDDDACEVATGTALTIFGLFEQAGRDWMKA